MNNREIAEKVAGNVFRSDDPKALEKAIERALAAKDAALEQLRVEVAAHKHLCKLEQIDSLAKDLMAAHAELSSCKERVAGLVEAGEKMAEWIANDCMGAVAEDSGVLEWQKILNGPTKESKSE